jgi:hypothetical protein
MGFNSGLKGLTPTSNVETILTKVDGWKVQVK